MGFSEDNCPIKRQPFFLDEAHTPVSMVTPLTGRLPVVGFLFYLINYFSTLQSWKSFISIFYFFVQPWWQAACNFLLYIIRYYYTLWTFVYYHIAWHGFTLYVVLDCPLRWSGLYSCDHDIHVIFTTCRNCRTNPLTRRWTSWLIWSSVWMKPSGCSHPSSRKCKIISILLSWMANMLLS